MAEPRRARVRRSGQAVVDSGPLIALFNGADRWHAPVLDWLRANPSVRLVSTWPVLTEVCALLARRLNNDAALDFLRWVERGAIEIDAPQPATLPDVLAISERFADLPFDLADASVAEAAARLNIGVVVSIDSDFEVYRDKTGRRLDNLLMSKHTSRRR
jgi:predicted nucleic acid-binding protein